MAETTVVKVNCGAILKGCGLTNPFSTTIPALTCVRLPATVIRMDTIVAHRMINIVALVVDWRRYACKLYVLTDP